jgi:hypothetical protein
MGDGPTRSILRAGVRKLVEGSPIFGLRGDVYHPLFFPVATTIREDMFWIAGFWSAMHLVTLLLTPDPISPWLLYAAVYGESGIPTDIEYIRALDPHSATTLEPWFAFQATDSISDDAGEPIQQLLMHHLGIHEVSSYLLPEEDIYLFCISSVLFVSHDLLWSILPLQESL